MEEWLKISLILCAFGFLKEIRPSEPFVYEFLIDKTWRNITEDQVTQEVYPVATYSYLAQLVIVFLITDLCRYKPLIILLGLSGITVWGLLIWTRSLFELQIVEVFYGTFCATEVAYFTYIYAKVNTEYYQQVTSHTRAAILAGRAISGILAQLLISLNWMDYLQLNYITFAAMILATAWAIFLPSVPNSIYFHQPAKSTRTLQQKINVAFQLMKTHFAESFSNKYVIKWSIWWALSSCGFIQVQTYMQPLWDVIQTESNESIYNGAVEAILTVLGFLGALLAGILRTNWKVKGDLTISLCSLLQGFILLFTSQTEKVMVSYICYVCFGALFHTTITIASSEIAKNIKDDSYGLVFGFNTLLALSCQTCLQAIIVTNGVGFALAPRDQYIVYGAFHICIAIMYIIIGFAVWFQNKRDYRKASIVSS